MVQPGGRRPAAGWEARPRAASNLESPAPGGVRGAGLVALAGQDVVEPQQPVLACACPGEHCSDGQQGRAPDRSACIAPHGCTLHQGQCVARAHPHCGCRGQGQGSARTRPPPRLPPPHHAAICQEATCECSRDGVHAGMTTGCCRCMLHARQRAQAWAARPARRAEGALSHLQHTQVVVRLSVVGRRKHGRLQHRQRLGRATLLRVDDRQVVQALQGGRQRWYYTKQRRALCKT